MLAAAFHAKKLRLFPESDTLFFCNHEFTTDLINQALASYDKSPWESKAQDSDDEDDNALKNRMKSASRRVFARILEEVEGETAAATLPAATSP